MKILFKIIVIVAALLAAFIVLFNVSDDVWYEAHVQAVRIFAKEDGIICLTPYTCIGVIHEYNDLYRLQMEHAEKYGVNAPDRPMQLYGYNTDMHAYVRWYHY